MKNNADKLMGNSLKQENYDVASKPQQKNITTEQNSGELSVKEHRENNLRYRMEIMKRIKS